MLTEKEESLRKLKEALRKSQQQGDESCKSLLTPSTDIFESLSPTLVQNKPFLNLSAVLEGGELSSRLTNPKGMLIKSSVLLEKSKLEEEVQQLHLKITHLER